MTPEEKGDMEICFFQNVGNFTKINFMQVIDFHFHFFTSSQALTRNSMDFRRILWNCNF